MPTTETLGNFWNMGVAQPAMVTREPWIERNDALKILEKDSLNLGNLNPLIHPTDLSRMESVNAVRYTVLDKIEKYEGLNPTLIESTVVYEPGEKKSELRFVTRFEVPQLSEIQLALLEELVEQTYGITVRTRTDSKGNDVPPESYPPTQIGEEAKSKTGGWYMGPNLSPTTSLHTGLFVFKDLGQVNKDNFLEDTKASSKYIIEVREAGQYQTDLVTFITQVAGVLGNGGLLDRGSLLYETYYDLIRLSLKKVDTQAIYGMDEAIDLIRRELLTPLASPDISRAVDEEPQSVLMVGVPGTGKTLIVEQLLRDESGLFILPIDPFELQKELRLPKEKQRLLPRIAEVGRITGKRVILHVDDIENMVEDDLDTHSTMLNLMAGVQESGFYIIASTNNPEKIDPALLQPQRFGVLIHCGLQDEQARYEILKIHAPLQTTQSGLPLWTSDKVREVILKNLAKGTEYFTPRYLASFATVAKSRLIDRIARGKGKRIGLTEADLEGYTFTVEDWLEAAEEVSAKYDRNAVRRRDEELKSFVKKHMREPVGYRTNNTSLSIFSRDVYEQIALLEAEIPAN